MVLIAPIVGAALFLSGLTAAAPTNSYDSSSSNSNYGSSNDNSNYGSSNSNSNYGSSKDNSNYGSSNDNSNYGSSNSNSNYGNSNSNYGNSNSNSNYGNSNNNNNYDSSSSSSYESSSSYNNNNNYQTNNNYETSSTTTAYNSYQTSNYGSGSNYWGGSGYEDCVNQCIAQFGGGETGGGSYQATATSGSYGSKGSGATHTVVVAPHKGVFRMVPFATNASVGDTIEFHWGADQHTVTKSSQLLPCNKSAEAPVFASGEQNTSFVFTQVVNDTNPTFYYCGTATHCEKGMFGIINPATTTPGSPSSVGGMMQSMAANDSDLSAYAAYTSNLTTNNAVATNWGSTFDMSSIPEWAHGVFADNVMYTRGVIAKNPDIVASDNSINLSSVSATPLMLPLDTNQLNAVAAPASDSSAPAATSGGDAAAAPAGAAETAPPSASPSDTKPNGASSVASPRLLVAAAVVVATIFAL